MGKRLSKKEKELKLKREEIGKALHLPRCNGEYILMHGCQFNSQVWWRLYKLLDLAVMLGVWEVKQPSDAKDFFDLFFSIRFRYYDKDFIASIVDYYWNYLNS